ncbi:MAG: hypothetical protein JNM46_08185 [Anaerolineales bacterium]|nr:hypothetical protein [Anaerolineales bacterium]
MATIVFNGKSYNSVEEMPLEARQAYEQIANMLVDKNGNGIPDFLEGDIVKNISSFYTAAKSINYNGAVYSNINELPPDVQAKVQSAFTKVADMGLIPQGDFEQHASKHTVHNESHIKSTPFVSREYNPVIQEDKSPNIMIWLLVGIGLMICLGIVAVAIFFLM